MKYEILVNKNNEIAESFIQNINLIEIKNIYDETVLIEEETFKNYLELKKHLKEKNIFIEIDSVYRSIIEQEEIMKEFKEKYGENYAKSVVAVPKTSEHHTGLAIDLCLIVNNKCIVENEELMKLENIWKEVHSELFKYGFILRYQIGKEEITGYNYEPWHIRYVGLELAKQMQKENLCLEEYYNKKEIIRSK